MFLEVFTCLELVVVCMIDHSSAILNEFRGVWGFRAFSG